MIPRLPDCITKELQLAAGPLPGQRRIRISTNFLQLYGFTPGTRLEARPRANGFDLLPSSAPDAPWKIHQRCYPQRRNNPSESLVDIQATQFIDRHVPTEVNRLHYTLRTGIIEARLVYPHLFNIRRAMRLRSGEELNAFLALSSGLDAVCLREAGFAIKAVLEYRPHEARDGTQDLTETGVCTFLANHSPQLVFNEDITTADIPRISRLARRIAPIAVLNLGLQCDDHSLAKSPTLRRAQAASFEPSARELSYYAVSNPGLKAEAF